MRRAAMLRCIRCGAEGGIRYVVMELGYWSAFSSCLLCEMSSEEEIFTVAQITEQIQVIGLFLEQVLGFIG